MALAKEINVLGESLSKQVLGEEPSSSTCVEIISSLKTSLSSSENTVNIELLEKTLIGKTLTKAMKSFKRHKRTAEKDEQVEWQTCLDETESLLAKLKQIVSSEHSENKKKKAQQAREEGAKPGLPKSVSAYKTRLESQKKEIYKNPPALPPSTISIEEEWVGEPKRSKETGELTFVCGQDKGIASLLKDFKPNRTPEEVLRSGSFGGTYFRPIVSAVTNIKYKASDVLRDSVKPEWISGLDKSKYLTSVTYVAGVNKYKVKCGGSLGMWESSGWIADSDPYGWFQWYCRFYQGRRCGDDERQISRWLKSAGPKGRFRSQLCNKIFAAGGMDHVNDVRVSPVIRQTLLHWGLEITTDVLKKHGKRVGKL